MQHPQKREDQKKERLKRSPARTLMMICVALGLSLAFVLLLPVVKSLFPASLRLPPMRSAYLAPLGEADVTQLSEITVKHQGGDSYTLAYQDGELYLNGEGGKLALINEAYADLILKAATELMVQDVVAHDAAEVKEHLGDMGLEPPRISVRVRYLGGREDVLDLGDKVPETGYYYYRWSGEKGVYMCDSGIFEAFEYTAAMLLPVSQPVLHKTLIDHITLRLKGQEPMELQFSTDGAGHITGAMKAPYAYPLDTTAAEGLLTAASGFRLGTKQGDATPDTEALYGFDDPLAVIDIHQQAGAYGDVDENGQYVTQSAEEQTLRIVLGRKEGDYFYTCEYAGERYLVSNFLVAPLAAATPDALLSQHPADLGDAVILSIQVQMGGRMLDIRQQRAERVLPNNQLATDESGNTLFDTTYTQNGRPMTQAAFDGLISRLKQMKVSGNVDGSFSIGASTPRWQMVMTTQGGSTRTLAAYPMDAFFDALAVDGVVKHSLNAESLSVALAELMEAGGA